jgi:hypothetical protein|tara:strand:- start:5 stop:250 length:246 start_codon:yes stop_codon:yes gene_type:complete
MKKLLLDNLPTVWVIGIVLLSIVLVSNHANANPVLNWFETEKNKTIEYQKNSWANGKEQLANTKQSILNLFKKVTENDTQN